MTQRININQNWLFTKQSPSFADLSSVDAALWEAINIPHTWNAQDGATGGNNYYRGLCWYRREITVDEIEQGKSYFIEIGAANSVANVYLNGERLGEHQGGYSQFRFDITQFIKEGSNELSISVDNSHIEEVYPLLADFTFYGGIYRDVNLIVTEDVHFDLMDLGSTGVYVSQRKVTTEHALIDVKALITKDSSVQPLLEVELVDRQERVVAHSTAVVDGDQATLELSVDNPHLWHGVKDPYLYECRVKLSVDGVQKDYLVIPTGLRFYEFRGKDGFWLNGVHTKLRGVSRHQDREAVGNALTEQHQIQDMELIKEVGANSIRLAHYQHSDFFYQLCDEAGMVIWAEPPYITVTSKTDLDATNAISQMRELIRQAYNHSSIVMWGVQNEIGIMPDERPLLDIVEQMHSVVEEEDTTRVTTQAQVMTITESDPANFATDVVAFNQYHGWYVGKTSGYEDFINKFQQANPDAGLGYSEYGAEGITHWHSEEPKVKDYSEEYHAKYHEEVLDIFNRYDCVWGSYVWNFFDFGSDMRDEGGVQGRNSKGLITFDRAIKKDAFYFYKSAWSDEPVVHITSKRFKDRAQDLIKVKVYSNLEGLTLTNNGEVIPLLSKQGTSGETIHWFEVRLEDGYNKLEAEAQGVLDVAEFRKVMEPNPNYVLPKKQSNSAIDQIFNFGGDDENVRNWFDDAIEDEQELTFEYPDGYLSIKEKVCDIIAHPEGLHIMEELFKPMLESEEAKMAFGFSFEFIAELKPEYFPKGLVYHLNKRLNQVKKLELA